MPHWAFWSNHYNLHSARMSQSLEALLTFCIFMSQPFWRVLQVIPFIRNTSYGPSAVSATKQTSQELLLEQLGLHFQHTHTSAYTLLLGTSHTLMPWQCLAPEHWVLNAWFIFYRAWWWADGLNQEWWSRKWFAEHEINRIGTEVLLAWTPVVCSIYQQVTFNEAI